MSDIHVVMVHTAKSGNYTVKAKTQLEEQGITYTIVDGDKINPFNYNQALNKGAAYCQKQYCLFANNDLNYHKGWDIELVEAMRKYDLRSASPYCEKSMSQFNFKGKVEIIADKEKKWTGKWLAGWAIAMRMDLWKEIQGFDTRVDFWFSDNIYEWQLKKINEKHGLILTSRVDHYGSRALTTLDKVTSNAMTYAQQQKYINATGERVKW